MRSVTKRVVDQMAGPYYAKLGKWGSSGCAIPVGGDLLRHIREICNGGSPYNERAEIFVDRTTDDQLILTIKMRAPRTDKSWIRFKRQPRRKRSNGDEDA